MSIQCTILFKGKHLYTGNQVWNDLIGSHNVSTLSTVFETIEGHVARGGAAMILMPDESSVKHRLDRPSEVAELVDQVNADRAKAGLQPVGK